MQFQVPQFIDTEDKIIGPLSLRQFAFIGIGGVLSAIIYLVAQPWLWALCSLFIFGIAIALAFIKIQGRPFLSVMIAAFNFYWKPQTYVWQQEEKTIHPSVAKVSTEANESALEDILARSKLATHRPEAAITGISPARPRAETPAVPVEPPAMPITPVAPAAPITPVAPAYKAISAAPTVRVARAAPVKSEITKSASASVARAAASVGSALHKSWENLQTGAGFAKKSSDKQFLDRKMAERYQIFQRISGDRHAARRIDYR